jgi:hypothetical protein
MTELPSMSKRMRHLPLRINMRSVGTLYVNLYETALPHDIVTLLSSLQFVTSQHCDIRAITIILVALIY